MKNILSLISVCAILSCAEGKNLLRNSSFELGSAEYSITAGIPYSASDFSPGKGGNGRFHPDSWKIQSVFPESERKHDAVLLPRSPADPRQTLHVLLLDQSGKKYRSGSPVPLLLL